MTRKGKIMFCIIDDRDFAPKVAFAPKVGFLHLK